jgi:hypothetical protein
MRVVMPAPTPEMQVRPEEEMRIREPYMPTGADLRRLAWTQVHKLRRRLDRIPEGELGKLEDIRDFVEKYTS